MYDQTLEWVKSQCRKTGSHGKSRDKRANRRSTYTHSTNEGILGIELIDAKTRSLVWRMFATEKVYHTEPAKIWKVADDSIKKAFKGYPPSTQDIAAKKEQWAKEDAEKKPSQP